MYALLMMVRNEENVIKSIQSVSKYIDTIIISDTGSEQKYMKQYDFINDMYRDTHDIHIRYDKMIDFSTNRNIIIDYANTVLKKQTYMFFMDGNEELVATYDFKKNTDAMLDNIDIFTVDAIWDDYGNVVTGSTVKFSKILLIKSHTNVRYSGAVHEFIDIVRIQPKFLKLEGVNIYKKVDSVEFNKTNDRIKTMDIELLTKDMNDGKYLDRCYFYLAKCYRSRGEYDKAIEYYKKRINFKDNENVEMTYLAYLDLGQIYQKNDDERSIYYFMMAYEICQFIDPIYYIGVEFYKKKAYNAAYTIMTSLREIKEPTSVESHSVVKDAFNSLLSEICFKSGKIGLCQDRKYSKNVYVIVGGICRNPNITWDINSIDNNTDISGAEIMSINMAIYLVKQNKNVVFVCNVDDVKRECIGDHELILLPLKLYEEFIPTAEIYRLIIIRYNQYIRTFKNIAHIDLILDDLTHATPMYDLPDSKNFTVHVRSWWHRKYFNKLYPSIKTNILPCGIDPKIYKRIQTRDIQKCRIIYVNEERGILNLIKLSTILSDVAVIDIYTVDEYRLRDYIKNKLNIDIPECVHFKQRLPYNKYVKIIYGYDMWIYLPDEFMETFCITAIEMGICEVLQVHNFTGGLSETSPYAVPYTTDENTRNIIINRSEYTSSIMKSYEHCKKYTINNMMSIFASLPV